MSKTTTGAARYLFAACEAKTGDALAKLVLISLANRADNNGECYPSLVRIADDCETSESSVKRKLIVLEALGLIVRINRTIEGMKTSNLYRIKDRSERPMDRSESHGGRVTVTRGVGSERPIKRPLETPKETERANQFDAWWDVYPKKKDKKTARQRFMKLTEKALTACLADNLKARYKDTDPKFIPMPSTYLNGERWDDEIDDARKAPSSDKAVYL